MDRTRQYLLAQTGSISTIVDPPAAPEGGGDKETPQEGASKDGKTPDTPDDDGEGDDDGDDFESLPPKTKAEIKDLRKESARYRTANKELTEKLAEAKSQADIDAAVAAHQGRVTELEVELAMERHTKGFTPEQLALVDGSTPEEIEEKANKVRAALAIQNDGDDDEPRYNPHAGGGRRPGSDSPEGLTPLERAKAVRERTGRRRF